MLIAYHDWDAVDLATVPLSLSLWLKHRDMPPLRLRVGLTITATEASNTDLLPHTYNYAATGDMVTILGGY